MSLEQQLVRAQGLLSEAQALNRLVDSQSSKTHLEIDEERFRLPDYTFDVKKLPYITRILFGYLQAAYWNGRMYYNFLKHDGNINGPKDQYNYRFLRQSLQQYDALYQLTGDTEMLDIVDDALNKHLDTGLHKGFIEWEGRAPNGAVSDGKSNSFPAGTLVFPKVGKKALKWLQNMEAEFMKREGDFWHLLYLANNKPVLKNGKWVENLILQVDALPAYGTSLTVFDEAIANGCVINHGFKIQVAATVPGPKQAKYDKTARRVRTYQTLSFTPKTENRTDMFAGYDNNGKPRFTFNAAYRPEGFYANFQTIMHGGCALAEIHRYRYLSDRLATGKWDERDRKGYKRLLKYIRDAIDVVQAPKGGGLKLPGGVDRLERYQFALWGHYWDKPSAGHAKAYLTMQTPMWVDLHLTNAKDELGRGWDDELMAAMANTVGMVWHQGKDDEMRAACASGVSVKKGTAGKADNINRMTGGATFATKVPGAGLDKNWSPRYGGMLVAHDPTPEDYNLRAFNWFATHQTSAPSRAYDLYEVTKDGTERRQSDLDAGLTFAYICLKRPDFAANPRKFML